LLLPWLTKGGGCLVLAVAVVVLLLVIHRRVGSVLLSPVQTVAGGLLALALLGAVLYRNVASAEGGGSIFLDLSDLEIRNSQFLILLSTLMLLIGALTALSLSGDSKRLHDAEFRGVNLSDRSADLIALFAPIPLLLSVGALSPGKIFYRQFYIHKHIGSNIVWSAGSVLSVAAIAGLGYLWAARKFRSWVIFLMLNFTVLFLGMGSRRLALIPILFALGAYAAKPSRRAQLVVLISFFISIWLVQLPLAFRRLSAHGVIPYSEALPSIVSSKHAWAATGRNILISFALIGETASHRPFPARDLWISLSPLPGRIVGWYDIAPYHRLNAYTPTAGLGELGNAGWLSVILGSFIIGVVLAWIELRSRRLLIAGKQFFGLALITLSALFLLNFIQYNLRTAVRFLYYAFALDILANSIKFKRARPTAVAKFERVGTSDKGRNGSQRDTEQVAG
jgi:hypothetical protein